MPDPVRCFAVPPITAPKLPGLSFTIPGVRFAFDAKLCCKLFAFDIGLPPIPLPPITLAAIQEVLDEIVAEINAILAKIVIRCPRS